MQNKIISAVIAAIVVIGAYSYFGIRHQQTATYTAPTVGASNSSARIAQVTMTGGSGTPTTTVASVWCSMLNTDANDRIIKSFDFYIQGMETNEYVTLKVGTTTSPTSTAFSTNFINSIISTSSQLLMYATSTASANTYAGASIWPTNTYLQWVASGTVATATTTTAAVGSCNVNYMAE